MVKDPLPPMPSVPPPDPPFARLWRLTLPIAAGLAAIALGAGFVSDAGWPAVVFVFAVLFAAAGVASLVTMLVIRGRRAVEAGVDAMEDTIEDLTGDRRP